jgi:hypothetical protein
VAPARPKTPAAVGTGRSRNPENRNISFTGSYQCVAQRAILRIGGLPGRAHGWVQHAREVVRASSEARDLVGLAAVGHDIDAISTAYTAGQRRS